MLPASAGWCCSSRVSTGALGLDNGEILLKDRFVERALRDNVDRRIANDDYPPHAAPDLSDGAGYQEDGKAAEVTPVLIAGDLRQRGGVGMRNRVVVGDRSACRGPQAGVGLPHRDVAQSKLGIGRVDAITRHGGVGFLPQTAGMNEREVGLIEEVLDDVGPR